MSFAPAVDVETGTGPEVLAAGDFNSDGRIDLAFTDYGIPGIASTQDVSVVLNRSIPGETLEFSPRTAYRVGNQPLGVFVTDVNGDGKPDLVVSNNFSFSVSVLLNQTPPGADQPSFRAPVDFPASGALIGPETLAAGDLNADGRPDIVTPNFLSDHGMSVLMNTTAPDADMPSFEPKVDYDPGSGPQQIAIADYDGNGTDDIAVALQFSTGIGSQLPGVAVYANHTEPGDLHLDLAAPIRFSAGVGPSGLVQADFNRDGRPDLAVPDNAPAAGGVSVLLNETTFPR